MSNNDPLRRWKLTGLVATVVIVLSFPLYLVKERIVKDGASPGEILPATFVGREKCRDCHRDAFDGWAGSHHDMAMDLATDETVLADFNDSSFTHNGIVTKFYRNDTKFFVHTQGPGGAMGDFQVTNTFGFYPLQQYLIPMPGGRLQCLTIAWDVVKKRWYLLPNHVDNPDDWLHWTRNGQNWNGMCAECHSTNLEKNYDPETDSYRTTWSEIDVSCEACHGPGSLHVKWAEVPPMARLEKEGLGLVVQTWEIGSKEEVELCAPCHSRRTVLGEYDHSSKAYFDTFLPALLREGVYFPDGQILEEDYVYGSFVQSKMYRSGIRCSDCHDSHSLKLKKEGNDLCLQCHRADTYNSSKHHFHKKYYRGKESVGWSCVRCHMPGRDYMGIDNRADHSIRVPRPDLSLELGTPNSCSMVGCHSDKPVKWAADWYTKWYGISRKSHFGTIIAGGRKGKVGALDDLSWLAANQLYPSIVRSTALSLISSYGGERVHGAFEQALMDRDPLVRHTALAGTDIFSPDKRAKLVGPLLWDVNRVVRMEAARNLVEVPADSLKPDQRVALTGALEEYIEAMNYSLDFSFAGFNLGNLYAAKGEAEKAVKYYMGAIGIDDLFYPAKINLAMLYNGQGKNREAEKLLLEVLTSHPELHQAAYSLGLLYAEMGEPEKALKYLGKAANGMPKRARVHYNYGLLLQQSGLAREAEKELRRSVSLDPSNLDYLYALADHFLKRNMLKEARKVGVEMVRRFPDNPLGKRLLEHIDSEMGSGPAS